MADAPIPALALLLGGIHVPEGEQHPVEGPEDAEGGGGDGVPQAGDEDEHEVVGVVLEVVRVGALGRVEAHHALAQVLRVGAVDLLLGGVGVGVGHAGGLAGGGDHSAVPEVDEGGEGAGQDDVAGGEARRSALARGKGGEGDEVPGSQKGGAKSRDAAQGISS